MEAVEAVPQPSLFDAAATRGASRRNGPRTSRDAARSVSGPVLRDQQRLVLEVIGDDATAYEVACVVAARGGFIQQNVAVKRLGELEERGMVARTGETRPGCSSRELTVFELTAAGRSWLAQSEVQ